MRRSAWRSRQPQPHRQPPASTGANGHQQIHIARQRLGRRPARLVKTRAQNELHRRSQHKLRPSRQHPVLAQQVAQHGQHQRRRQQQADSHRGKTGPRRRLFFARGAGCAAQRLVAGVAHCAPQQRVHGGGVAALGQGDLHPRRLGGQIHRHLNHARHLAQRTLDTARATGAGHAANRHINFLGILGTWGTASAGGGRRLGRGVHSHHRKP